MVYIWAAVVLLVLAFIVFVAAKSRKKIIYFNVESEADYQKIYSIIKNYMVFLPKYNQQLALSLTWEKELCKTRLMLPKDRTQSVRDLEIGHEYNSQITKSLIDNFWDKQGGYNKKFDPEFIPFKVWPKELQREFKHKVNFNEIREIRNLGKEVQRLKTQVANKASQKRTRDGMLPPLGH